MFVNLRFLVLVKFDCGHGTSLQLLVKLRSLFLEECNIIKIDVTFFPEKLQTLCIWDCHLPKPLDLPNLKYLEKLQIWNRYMNVYMKANAISNLSRLEELHIPNGFKIWDDGSAVPAPILIEINKLTRLKSLIICFQVGENFGEENILCNLSEFNIRVGRTRAEYPSVFIKRSIRVYINPLAEEVLKSLIERAEEVMILKNNSINVSSIWNSNREAFTDLKYLTIYYNHTMEHLGRISQNEIQHSGRASFSKLITLEIRGCSLMKYLFSKSVAKCLVQLQELNIVDCRMMEAVAMNEGTSDGDIINFSKLKSLRLLILPRLKSFYGGNKDVHSTSTSNMGNSALLSVQFGPLFDEMVAFPSLEKLEINTLESTGDIWRNDEYIDNVSSSSFGKLKRLLVWKCNKLEIVIPLSMLHRLPNLEYLEIRECNSLRNVFQHSSIARDLIHLKRMDVIDCELMREIIGGAGEQEEITDDDDGIFFPELMRLELRDLPNLASFWCFQNSGEANTYQVEFPKKIITLGRLSSVDLTDLPNFKSYFHGANYECHMPALEKLKVYSCGLSLLFTSSVFRNLQRLKSLEISYCGLLEGIFEDVRGEETSNMNDEIIPLPRLSSVVLKHLPKLNSFIHSANYECHMPALEDVKVDSCGLNALFTSSVFRKLQALKKLTVSNCRLLEGIVQDVRGDETSDMNHMIIEFSRLTDITLEDLPNLKSFNRAARYAFNMPNLHYMRLTNCPRIENLTSLKTNTGFVFVTSDWNHGQKYLDLNNHIIILYHSIHRGFGYF